MHALVSVSNRGVNTLLTDSIVKGTVGVDTNASSIADCNWSFNVADVDSDGRCKIGDSVGVDTVTGACMTGYYTNSNVSGCVACSVCGIGEEILTACSSLEDTKCQSCERPMVLLGTLLVAVSGSVMANWASTRLPTHLESLLV